MQTGVRGDELSATGGELPGPRRPKNHAPGIDGRCVGVRPCCVESTPRGRRRRGMHAKRGDGACASIARRVHGVVDQTWRDDIDLTITQRPGHVMLKDYQRNGKPATQRRGGGL